MLMLITMGIVQNRIIAQKMVIDFRNQDDQSESINTIQKLHFDKGELKINFKSGQIQNAPLEQIQKLYFGDVSAKDEIKITKLNIYPNPASTEINVAGIADGAVLISIYQMDGRLITKKKITKNDSQIDISQLSTGIYFVSSNGFSAKFIKL